MSGRNVKGGGGESGGGDTAEERAVQKASISTWSLSDSPQLRCVTSSQEPAKAKSCYCCYPSIPAKSGTMLPGNIDTHTASSFSNTTRCTHTRWTLLYSHLNLCTCQSVINHDGEIQRTGPPSVVYCCDFHPSIDVIKSMCHV